MSKGKITLECCSVWSFIGLFLHTVGSKRMATQTCRLYDVLLIRYLSVHWLSVSVVAVARAGQYTLDKL